MSAQPMLPKLTLGLDLSHTSTRYCAVDGAGQIVASAPQLAARGGVDVGVGDDEDPVHGGTKIQLRIGGLTARSKRGSVHLAIRHPQSQSTGPPGFEPGTYGL
jgi:hypothetical protein